MQLDLRLLVIAADGSEANLTAIKQILDYIGTPYTVYLAAVHSNSLTMDKLCSGDHGYYQGIILTTSQLSYQRDGLWSSGLSAQEWETLRNYQLAMGVRELCWYAYPSLELGYQSSNRAQDTSLAPLVASLTEQGRDVFSYLQPDVSLVVQNAYTYLAKSLDDGESNPLLMDTSGHALALIRRHPDGRETLSLTFDSNSHLLHCTVLAYGLIRWLTRGIFLGEWSISLSVQIDDVFIADSEWLPETPCGTAEGETGATYRITGEDLQAVINWIKEKRSYPLFTQTTLTMAYNGCGVDGTGEEDTLLPVALREQELFYWVNHSYAHTNLDAVDYEVAFEEITMNAQVAQELAFTHYDECTMVTPDVSGLENPAFLQAAYDAGIRYLVSDTSKDGHAGSTPNAGIVNRHQPGIVMTPRRPNNLFYNVSTPEGWVAEYNCLYRQFWGRDLSYQEILAQESQQLLFALLKGDWNPWMFHQSNLRAYDGTHSLLTDLLDAVFESYARWYNLEIANPSMERLGVAMMQRLHKDAAEVEATIVPGVSITLTAQQSVRVPVTGLSTDHAQFYGGEYVSYIDLETNQSITLHLSL